MNFDCNTAAASFNEDIGAWTTVHCVTVPTLVPTACSVKATSFNQDISGWAVHSVTDMTDMFGDASPPPTRDLGWCVDDDVFDPYAWVVRHYHPR